MAGMRSLAAAILLFLACAGVGAQPAPGEALRNRIAAAESRLREHPQDPTSWFLLARFQAEAGDVRACVAALEKVEQLGDGFLPAKELGFERVWADPAFQAVRSRLEAKLPRLDFAPVAFDLPDRQLLPEGIAYDAPSHAFFLGSLARHAIVRVDADRKVTSFADASANLDAILGLAVDAPRRVLYAVSTSALTEAGSKQPRNAIFAFDIDTHRLLRRVEVPEAVQLNDVSVAFGGRVFTTDSGSGAVYEIPKDGAPRVIVPAGRLRGSNGLAASPDGRLLYVAHTTGIAVVELSSGDVQPLTAPQRDNLAAIDGLYQWEGSLVAVQNVTTPGRVILVTLAKDGRSVTRVRTLLSHHHNRLDEPTTGALTEDGFYLLAATGVSHYAPDGTIHDPDTVPLPTVVRVLLSR